jgi:uncharacterized protein
MKQSTQSPCLKYCCYECCKNTNMLLSQHDIQTIQDKGYSIDFFVEDNNGWLQLKNKENRCVFHNKTHCTIYNYRPQGCRLYPIVYQKDDHSAIIDAQCLHPNFFHITTTKKNQLFPLIKQLQIQRKQRQ